MVWSHSIHRTAEDLSAKQILHKTASEVEEGKDLETATKENNPRGSARWDVVTLNIRDGCVYIKLRERETPEC